MSWMFGVRIVEASGCTEISRASVIEYVPFVAKDPMVNVPVSSHPRCRMVAALMFRVCLV